VLLSGSCPTTCLLVGRIPNEETDCWACAGQKSWLRGAPAQRGRPCGAPHATSSPLQGAPQRSTVSAAPQGPSTFPNEPRLPNTSPIQLLLLPPRLRPAHPDYPSGQTHFTQPAIPPRQQKKTDPPNPACRGKRVCECWGILKTGARGNLIGDYGSWKLAENLSLGRSFPERRPLCARGRGKVGGVQGRGGEREGGGSCTSREVLRLQAFVQSKLKARFPYNESWWSINSSLVTSVQHAREGNLLNYAMVLALCL
jgi:hypothetical protein